MKIKKTEIFFYLSYVSLYISLFMGDISDMEMINTMAELLRLFAYIAIIVQVFFYKLDFRGWIKFAIIFILTLFYGVRTGDLYWSILVIFIYASRNIQQNKILKISTFILICGTFCVLFLCLLGILPDVMTARNTNLLDTFNRHSFGFYHSNVLPLLTLYLELYYVTIKKKNLKSSIIVLFFGLHLILYLLCDSRNAFYLGIFFSALIFIEKYIGIKNIPRKILYYTTKYSVVIMSTFSFSMLFLLLRGGIWDVIDNIFSGRFRLGIFKMRRVGLHLISFMSNDDFFSDSISYVNNQTLDTVVLDNGYLYIILRYGILVIFFYIIVSFLLANKFKDDIYVLTVLLVVFMANFVDNDLVDYSFLPFILIAFANFRLSYRKIGLKMNRRRSAENK